jgi:hypothetical protein
LAKRNKRINWNEVRQYAVMGARARLREIQAEMAKILAAFPQLGMEAGVPAVQAQGAAPTRKGRLPRKRTMSAAQRKAVSERMKRYWAERRLPRQQNRRRGLRLEREPANRRPASPSKRQELPMK